MRAALRGPYLELFGRRERPGWTIWGSDLTRAAQIQGVVSGASGTVSDTSA